MVGVLAQPSIFLNFTFIMDRKNANVVHTGDRHCQTQSTRIEGQELIELYCCARPQRDQGNFAAQARSTYENLSVLLASQGLYPHHLVTEKLFFSDIGHHYSELQAIRAAFYRQAGIKAERTPATSFLQQSPCQPGRLFELQAYGLKSAGGAYLEVRTLPDLPPPAAGKLVTCGSYTHVYLQGLVGDSTADKTEFSRQCTSMFARAASLLDDLGLSFSQVIRTWIYLENMERDYHTLNQVRNAFYGGQHLVRLPASTGIQGKVQPAFWQCAADLYALTGGEGEIQIEVMHAPTLNEAPAYGAAFSRGLKLSYPDRTAFYISGTASIDTQGEVVHPGNIEGQVDRMFVNLEALLGAQGVTLEHVVSAITYLKHAEHLKSFERICDTRSVPPGMLNTTVVADICRPEWLCEIEVAVLCLNDA